MQTFHFRIIQSINRILCPRRQTGRHQDCRWLQCMRRMGRGWIGSSGDSQRIHATLDRDRKPKNQVTESPPSPLYKKIFYVKRQYCICYTRGIPIDKPRTCTGIGSTKSVGIQATNKSCIKISDMHGATLRLAGAFRRDFACGTIIKTKFRISCCLRIT